MKPSAAPTRAPAVVVGHAPRRRRQGRLELLGRAAHRDAHPVLLDRDLADAGLLDDSDELADPLGARLVDAAGAEALVAARAPADRLQQRLGLLAEEREQQQLLLARGEAFRLVAQRLEVDRRLLLGRAAGAARRRAGRSGRSGRAGGRSGPRSARGARRRPSGSGSPRARAAAPASRGSGRSARRAAASRPPRGSRRARRAPRRAGRPRRARAGARRARRRGPAARRAPRRARRSAARAA